jgi:hypothetical protein
MPLNQEYLQELSALLVRNLRRSDYYLQLPETERAKLEARLQVDAEEGFLPLLPGAHPDDLENLVDAVEEELGIELPSSAIEILRQVDGFCFNGVILYGVDSELRDDAFDSGPGILAETSNLWSAYTGNAEAFLFLGDSDLWYYAVELKTGQPVVLDRSNFAVEQRFQTSDEMVNEMLRAATGAFDEV